MSLRYPGTAAVRIRARPPSAHEPPDGEGLNLGSLDVAVFVLV
jgi:hypothetical protein